MGRIIMDPNYFPVAAKFLNKISPEVFGLDYTMLQYGSPIATEFYQMSELQRIIFTASPNILMPMAGYMVVEGATRIKNPLLRRVAYGAGISMALEPLVSIIPSFVDHTITSPYVVMDHLAGLAGIENFEMDALPFALGVIGATALAYGPGRKLAKKVYNAIFEKKEKNIIEFTYISPS